MAWVCALTMNDGGLTVGGSPSLLSSHPSVTMESEVISLKVGPHGVVADCRFVFRNRGAACTVRMGFPDEGWGADSPYEETADEDWPKAKIIPVLKNFKSWVNGKSARCELVKGKGVGEIYHAKLVKFGRNARVEVRDTYETELGSAITPDGHGVMSETGYVFRTGSSWHNRIGRSDFSIEWLPSSGFTPTKVVPFAWSEDEAKRFPSMPKPPGLVLVRLPGNPTLKGRKVSTTIRNWRPTKDSDAWISWDYRKANAG